MDPARLTPLFAAASAQTPLAQRSSTDGFFWAITTDEPSIERQPRPLAEGRCDLPPNQQGERRPVGARTSSNPDTSETTSVESDEVVLYAPPGRQAPGPTPKSKQRQAPSSTAALFSHKYGTSSHGTQGASADGIINRSQNTEVRWEYKIKSIRVTPDWPSKLAEVQWNELKPKSENLGKGAFGSVSLFAAGNRLIAGKSAIGELKDAQGNPFDALLVELSRYATVYHNVGLHPNLCRVYGIGTVDLHGEPTRMLLMDAVPGSHAQDAAIALRHCLETGHITAPQFWGAVQYIGRCMLDVIKAFAQAGLVHRDIKPENVLINKHTGEVIGIDAGVSTEIASPLKAGTPEFMPDDHTEEDRGADAGSDVYSAGATMATIAEGPRRVISIKTNSEFVAPHAKDGAQRGLVGRLDAHGKFYTRPANQIDSAYSTFITQCLSRKDGKRLMPDQALKDQFLRDSMLDDDAARAVLQKALNIADTENAKDKNDQWLTVKPARSAPDAQGRSSYPLDPEERARLRQGINSIATYAQYLDSCGDDQALLSELSAFASDTEVIRRLDTDVKQCVRRLLKMESPFSIVPKGELVPFTRPETESTGKPEAGVSASTEKRQRPINASHSVDLNGVQRRPRAEGQIMNPVKIRPRGLIELARTLGIVTTGTSEENSQRLFAELKRYMDEASAFIRQIDGLPDSVKPNKFTLDEIQRRADNAARIIDKIHRQTLVYNKHKDVGKLSGSPELGKLRQKLGRLYQSRINQETSATSGAES